MQDDYHCKWCLSRGIVYKNEEPAYSLEEEPEIVGVCPKCQGSGFDNSFGRDEPTPLHIEMQGELKR